MMMYCMGRYVLQVQERSGSGRRPTARGDAAGPKIEAEMQDTPALQQGGEREGGFRGGGGTALLCEKGDGGGDRDGAEEGDNEHDQKEELVEWWAMSSRRRTQRGSWEGRRTMMTRVGRVGGRRAYSNFSGQPLLICCTWSLRSEKRSLGRRECQRQRYGLAAVQEWLRLLGVGVGAEAQAGGRGAWPATRWPVRCAVMELGGGSGAPLQVVPRCQFAYNPNTPPAPYSPSRNRLAGA